MKRKYIKVKCNQCNSKVERMFVRKEGTICENCRRENLKKGVKKYQKSC